MYFTFIYLVYFPEKTEPKMTKKTQVRMGTEVVVGKAKTTIWTFHNVTKRAKNGR